MKCVICRLGETHAGKIVATLQRGETTVILKNVPAEVCDNCVSTIFRRGSQIAFLSGRKWRRNKGLKWKFCSSRLESQRPRRRSRRCSKGVSRRKRDKWIADGNPNFIQDRVHCLGYSVVRVSGDVLANGCAVDLASRTIHPMCKPFRTGKNIVGNRDRSLHTKRVTRVGKHADRNRIQMACPLGKRRRPFKLLG